MKINNEIRSVWSAIDALVLRAIAQVLGQHLYIHPDCLHVKGNGGVAGGLRFVEEHYKNYQFFWRSDVKGYYRHIRHGVLVRQLDRQIKEKRLLHVLRRYLNRVDTFAGFYATRIQGLNKGCPLAQVLGTQYLIICDILPLMARLARVVLSGNVAGYTILNLKSKLRSCPQREAPSNNLIKHT